MVNTWFMMHLPQCIIFYHSVFHIFFFHCFISDYIELVSIDDLKLALIYYESPGPISFSAQFMSVHKNDFSSTEKQLIYVKVRENMFVIVVFSSHVM